MRILIILAIDPGDEARPAPEFDGLLEAYYLLTDAGAELVLASTLGGSAWASSAGDRPGDSALARRFRADHRVRDILNDLLRLEDIYAEDFAAALCLGFAKFKWGAEQDRAGALIVELLALGKPVAVISPSQGLTISGAGEGLLMIGQIADAPRLAAGALLGALRSLADRAAD